LTAPVIAAAATALGVKLNAVSETRMRMVTHHQVGIEDVDTAIRVLSQVLAAAEPAKGAARAVGRR
jgi:hypothetical protein